jgi:hypothetical protein
VVSGKPLDVNVRHFEKVWAISSKKVDSKKFSLVIRVVVALGTVQENGLELLSYTSWHNALLPVSVCYQQLQLSSGNDRIEHATLREYELGGVNVPPFRHCRNHIVEEIVVRDWWMMLVAISSISVLILRLQVEYELLGLEHGGTDAMAMMLTTIILLC